MSGRGVLLVLTGLKGERMGATEMVFFLMHCASPHAQVCSEKTQGKNHAKRHDCRCITQTKAEE
jgi:hypothetical protein